MRMYLVVSLVLVSLVLPLQAWAGYDEGLAAYNKGDYTTARQEWWPLAQAGHAAAQYGLGMMSQKGQGVLQDDVQAVIWFRRAAEQGYVDAQFQLARSYFLGEGGLHDHGLGLTWLRRAAEQGSAAAQDYLGRKYYYGFGVPQDYAQALLWYRRAADQGFAAAQFNLGAMYEDGQGVPQDDQQAYFWLNLAAAHAAADFAGVAGAVSREDAAHNRDLVAARLTPIQRAQAQAQARTWQPKPETRGIPLPSGPPGPAIRR